MHSLVIEFKVKQGSGGETHSTWRFLGFTTKISNFRHVLAEILGGGGKKRISIPPGENVCAHDVMSYKK